MVRLKLSKVYNWQNIISCYTNIIKEVQGKTLIDKKRQIKLDLSFFRLNFRLLKLQKILYNSL